MSIEATGTQVRISLRRQAAMIGAYVRERVLRQVRAVAFIAVYLALFQALVLRAPIEAFLPIAGGMLAVVLGLAFFMEGLFLAIMPLGERCRLRLPARVGLILLVVFAAILGITATYAEPAIGFLKEQGSATQPWRAPLLYYLLNGGAPWTVGAVALGVGLAVVLGVFRSLRAWSLKRFVFLAIPLLLAVTAWAAGDPRTAALIGLAWDTGGVTTGPVTVPLVIALGIGVSRIAGRGDEPSGGLGVVTMASAMPVLMVLLLGLALAPRFPMPGSAASFFSAEHREQALRTVGGVSELRRLAEATLHPEDVARCLDKVHEPESAPPDASWSLPHAQWKTLVLGALKAILPLALVLLLTLRVLVRERLPHPDEVALGLAFSLLGVLLFSYGMDRGLSNLGNQAGRALPRAWASTARPDRVIVFERVDETALVRAVRPDGGTAEYLPTLGEDGPAFVPFDRAHYEAATRRYRWIPRDRPIAGGGRGWGYALVLAFVFAMGVGATVAEPSLHALGITLEELTTGTYKRSFLILTVALGVGVGMVAGFGRILFEWPLMPLLAGAYLLALALTLFSAEDIATIAWDSAGVTTGPITVPLVIATGLGIGREAGVVEAFGVVTMASVFPIVTVLLSGFVLAARRRALDWDRMPADGEPDSARRSRP